MFVRGDIADGALIDFRFLQVSTDEVCGSLDSEAPTAKVPRKGGQERGR